MVKWVYMMSMCYCLNVGVLQAGPSAPGGGRGRPPPRPPAGGRPPVAPFPALPPRPPAPLVPLPSAHTARAPPLPAGPTSASLGGGACGLVPSAASLVHVGVDVFLLCPAVL